MRKLASILFLMCFYFSLLGYHLFYFLQLENAKSEMVSFLKNFKQHKDVMELSFSNKDDLQLNWENDHEFNFNGEMYDVIDKKITGNRSIIRCISDDKETKLVKEYQKTNHNHSSENIIQLIAAPFLLPPPFSIKKPERNAGSPSFYLAQPLPQTSSPVLIPPPEIG